MHISALLLRICWSAHWNRILDSTRQPKVPRLFGNFFLDLLSHWGIRQQVFCEEYCRWVGRSASVQFLVPVQSMCLCKIKNKWLLGNFTQFSTKSGSPISMHSYCLLAVMGLMKLNCGSSQESWQVAAENPLQSIFLFSKPVLAEMYHNHLYCLLTNFPSFQNQFSFQSLSLPFLTPSPITDYIKSRSNWPRPWNILGFLYLESSAFNNELSTIMGQ